MRSRNQCRIPFASHFKVQPHRPVTKAANIDRDLKEVVQLCRMVEITFDVHTRQPNVQLVKHDAVGQVDGPEEFRFREFEETNVSAVKNNARRVNIAPAYALLNRVLFVHRFVKQTVSLRWLVSPQLEWNATNAN